MMNKSTIWPVVMARMSTVAIKATRPRIIIELAKKILLIVCAFLVCVAIIVMPW